MKDQPFVHDLRNRFNEAYHPKKKKQGWVTDLIVLVVFAVIIIGLICYAD